MSEELNLKELIIPRIGYYFAFIEDYRQCQNETYIATNIEEVYEKIVNYIFETIGKLPIQKIRSHAIPDYKYKVNFWREGKEKTYLFNFFIIWNEESQAIEIEYDDYQLA